MNMSGVLQLSLIALLCIIASLEAKKYECPVPTGVGPCVEECGESHGKKCPGKQMCCSNGCGHTCQDPVKIGFCPYIDQSLRCATFKGGCMSDMQCPGYLKCCPVPCSINSCQPPTDTLTKPGTCPPIMIGEQTCVNPGLTTASAGCECDNNCPADQKCCPRACLPKGCVAPQPLLLPSSTPYPPAPSTSTPYPPAPSSSTPYPPAPSTSTPYPPAPSSSTPYPPAPSSSTPYPPAPSSSTPYPPAPSSSTPYPPAPSTSAPNPPALSTSTLYSPAPSTSTPYPPAPSTSTPLLCSLFEKPGTCPPIMIGEQTCVNPGLTTASAGCECDNNCPEEQKCCPRACLPKGCVAPQPLILPSSTPYPLAPSTSTPYPGEKLSSSDSSQEKLSSSDSNEEKLSSSAYPQEKLSSSAYPQEKLSSSAYPQEKLSSSAYPVEPSSSTPCIE